MNPLAKSLNEQIAKNDPAVMEMLSDLGKNIYMPKGIITQGAEAKKKAHKYNATVGIATSKEGPMYLECMYEPMKSFSPEELFPYAPATGVLELRNAWLEKMLKDNPILQGKQTSLPLVTNALTHGLSIAADLFVDAEDYVVLPDKFWGNYRLTFSVKRGGEIVTYSTFTPEGGFNTEGLLEKARECGKISGKVVTILNFPNNPTGYSPTEAEAIAIADGLAEIAETGVKIVALVDDAYFGLFFKERCFKGSLFSLLAARSKNLLAVKLDGATKEEYAWGFRVGFITFAATGPEDMGEMLYALETKVSGLIRGTISNCPHPSQSAALRSLKDPEFYEQRARNNDIIKERCLEVERVLSQGRYEDEFKAYPFNSGYFMCIKLLRVDSEKLRTLLLDKYGVGVISAGPTDVRIAFSSVEKNDLSDLFEIIYKGCKEI